MQNKINYTKILLGLNIILFLLFTFFWILRNYFIQANEFFYWPFSFYMLLPLFGGVTGLLTSTNWGGAKSTIGRAILFLSFGLLAQVLGQLYYFISIDFLHIEIPYPSIGDIGYFGSIPLYITGIWFLSKAIGTKNALNIKSAFLVVLLPILLLIFSYIEFLKDYEFDWSAPLVIFLDFGYPFGQAIYISIAILTFLLSIKYLGGKLKYPVLVLLFALLCQYASDFVFLYQVNNETWTGGGINDFMYLFSYFVMTMGLLQFNGVLDKLKGNPVKPTQPTTINNSTQQPDVTVQ